MKKGKQLRKGDRVSPAAREAEKANPGWTAEAPFTSVKRILGLDEKLGRGKSAQVAAVLNEEKRIRGSLRRGDDHHWTAAVVRHLRMHYVPLFRGKKKYVSEPLPQLTPEQEKLFKFETLSPDHPDVRSGSRAFAKANPDYAILSPSCVDRFTRFYWHRKGPDLYELAKRVNQLKYIRPDCASEDGDPCFTFTNLSSTVRRQHPSYSLTTLPEKLRGMAVLQEKTTRRIVVVPAAQKELPLATDSGNGHSAKPTEPQPEPEARPSETRSSGTTQVKNMHYDGAFIKARILTWVDVEYPIGSPDADELRQRYAKQFK